MDLWCIVHNNHNQSLNIWRGFLFFRSLLSPHWHTKSDSYFGWWQWMTPTQNNIKIIWCSWAFDITFHHEIVIRVNFRLMNQPKHSGSLRSFYCNSKKIVYKIFQSNGHDTGYRLFSIIMASEWDMKKSTAENLICKRNPLRWKLKAMKNHRTKR